MRQLTALLLLSLLVVACGGDQEPAAPSGGPPAAAPARDEIQPLTLSTKPKQPPKPVVPVDPEAAIFNEVDRMMRSSDAEERLMAVVKLTEVADRKTAGRLLVKLLLDSDEDVRVVAAEAMGQIEYKAGAESLRTVLGRDEESAVRKQALLSLAKIAGKEAVPDLLRGLTDDDANVRSAAAILIGNSGSMDGVDALAGLIAGDDYDFSEQVRLSAVASIGKLKAKSAVDAVISALEDANVLVRTESAKTLGLLGEKKAVPGLIRLVDPEDNPDESPKTVEIAVKSLTMLTGEKIEFSLDHAIEAQEAARRAWMEWWGEHEDEY